MIPLPKIVPAKGDALNPYNGRWRQWYVDIADWLITHPGGSLSECAKDLGRHINTISFIYRSDIFQSYYRERRADFSARTDDMMRAKLTGVATKALDVITTKLEKQGDAIPMKFVTELAVGALDRLGYAPSAPGVSVNIDQRDQSQKVVQVAVSADALAEARAAMRAAEEKRAIESRAGARPLSAGPGTHEGSVLEGESLGGDLPLD